jgi:hypothetical protein
MTYRIKFTYRPISDTLLAFTDHDEITRAEEIIHVALGEDVTLEIVNYNDRPVFSGVQIMNASLMPFWTEQLSQFLTAELMMDFVLQLSYLSRKANDNEPENPFQRIIGERTRSEFPRLESLIVHVPQV